MTPPDYTTNMKNKGKLQENTSVKLCFADTSGSCVWSYKAIFRNGWFDNEGKNSRHDTLSDVDGCYVWYEVIDSSPTSNNPQE